MLTSRWLLIMGVALLGIYELAAVLTMRPTISQLTWRFKAAHPWWTLLIAGASAFLFYHLFLS